MKILQLCNKVPYPSLDGGAIAMLNMALSLAGSGNELTVLAMNTQKHRASSDNIPENLSTAIRFIYVDVDTQINPLKLVSNLLFSSQPYNAVRFLSDSFASRLKGLLKTESFDLVQLEGLYLCPYVHLIREFHSGKIAYRAHNIESDIWTGRMQAESHPLKKIYLKIISRRMLRYEKKFIDQYDILLPITAPDHEKFMAMGNTRPAHVAYTGIPENALHAPEKIRPPVSLFTIGALDWVPNQEGIRWFIEEIWPLLTPEFPDLSLHIAGRNAPEWFRKSCNIPGIVFHGEVPDAHRFMDDHDIMIVPLFTGSGLRIKIVEAMARSRAILTTPTGAKGLPSLSGKELLIGHQAADWAATIRSLLSDHEMYAGICREAFEYAKENFGDKAIIAKLLYFYRQQKIC
ncbi:MAG: glycosyltransferase [Bacteroidales bacterium]|nr:glycosyltransferase [Bacteroidales bacterium]